MDAEWAQQLSRGALAHAAGYSWEATADRLLELYAGITAGS
jgi:glycosyltransferase involved in cell wall biosynthesis